MAVITAVIPDDLNRRLEKERKQYGFSKSFLVRQILLKHYETKIPLLVGLVISKGGNGSKISNAK